MNRQFHNISSSNASTKNLNEFLVSADQRALDSAKKTSSAPQTNVNRVWYGPHILSWQVNALFSHQSARHSIPASYSKSLGAGMGYTYGGFKNVTLGTMFDYYRPEQHVSNTGGHTDEYIITVFGRYAKRWLAEAGFILLIEDNHFHRNISSVNEIAKSSFMQYGLAPHWRFGYRWIYSNEGNRFTFEPFAQLEILTTLQQKFTESGAPLEGLSSPSQVFCSTLTQTGMRLWQLLAWKYGHWVIHEKLAYFNITPFGRASSVTPIFVGEPTAVTLTNFVQNHFTTTFSLAHEWKNGCMLSAIYQGIFGDGLTSNMVTGNFSYNF